VAVVVLELAEVDLARGGVPAVAERALVWAPMLWCGAV